jgi:sugar lactone lactonase YvrE
MPFDSDRAVIRHCDVHSVIDLQLDIGESPLWDPVERVLWFVDILASLIYRLDPSSGSLDRFEMPASVGSLGLAQHGLLIVALRSGVHLFDPRTKSLEFLVHPEPNRSGNRLNDGRVGPDGAFWMGSMSEAQPYEPTGAFYRITSKAEVTLIRDHLYVSNGLAWNPDGTVMYHADSLVPAITAYAFNPVNGSVSPYTRFAELDFSWGHPDGAAVDIEGNYWSAGVTAGRINRFSPTGQLIESLQLPIAAPTMPCFGGLDMKTLYITSLKRSIAGAAQPGGLLSIRAEVPGLPPDVFGVSKYSRGS